MDSLLISTLIGVALGFGAGIYAGFRIWAVRYNAILPNRYHHDTWSR